MLHGIANISYVRCHLAHHLTDEVVCLDAVVALLVEICQVEVEIFHLVAQANLRMRWVYM